MMGVIAKTIVFSEPATSSASLTATDVIALCSFVVALLALGVSVAFAEVQRRHNILVARPHMDIELGVLTHVLRVTNHGPGVARFEALSAATDDETFDLLNMPQFYKFCAWLMKDPNEKISIERNAPTIGSYLAPGMSLDIISLARPLGEKDMHRLDEKTNSVAFNITVSSLYGRTYSDYHAPLRSPGLGS